MAEERSAALSLFLAIPRVAKITYFIECDELDIDLAFLPYPSILIPN